LRSPARWAAAALLALTCSWAWAQTPAPNEATTVETDSTADGAEVEEADIEEIEEIEEIEDVSESSVVAAAEEPGWTQIIGRLHPAAVHIPIGWVWLLALMEVLIFLTRRDALAEIGEYLAPATLIGCLPAIATGLIRASQLPQHPESMASVALHRNVALLMTSVILAAVLLRLGRRRNFGGRVRLLYLALLVAASFLAGLGGHLGGRMT